MHRQVTKFLNIPNKTQFITRKRFLNSNSYIDVKDEVRCALETRKPVVALESTIITHGMPFPNNVKCATEVENIVRLQGAIPATVAIINGRIKVGLSKDELTTLGDAKVSKPIKTSRRDLPYIVSKKLNGGTTICGTLIVANKVGMPIFASGGLGGVHRGAHKTFDISADLIELGRSSVAVVSSGVKSILDIPKTLEYLETQGVFVATFGNDNEFPAFYSRVSGTKAPYCVKTANEAAKIIKSNRDMNMQSGMLFAVPIPEEDALLPDVIDNAIEEALRGIKHNMIGKDITPYLLTQVSKITGGRSLESNIALIKNNAKVAADIAVELANLEAGGKSGDHTGNEGSLASESLKGRPVVIGGSNMDCSAHLASTDIKLDGRIHDGRFSYLPGGVGRNICESLCKLGCPPNFISALGSDEQGKLLRTSIPVESSHFLQTIDGHATGQCIIVFDRNGDCKFLMGDMQIHKQITCDVIHSHEDLIKNAPLIVLDANLSLDCLECVLKLATEYSIPVLFEPTDVEISQKPFETRYWKAVKLITPNLNELRHITSFLDIPENKTPSSDLEEAAYLAKQLANNIENVIVTLGPSGVLVTRKGLASDSFLNNDQTSKIQMRHYPCKVIKDFVNVSGAGDCLASGIIAGTLKGLSETQCVSVGLAAAQSALYSQSPVPREIFDATHWSWNSAASFKTINI